MQYIFLHVSHIRIGGARSYTGRDTCDSSDIFVSVFDSAFVATVIYKLRNNI